MVEKQTKISSRIPFILMHIAALSVFFTGFSWIALGICIFLYFARAFGVTAGFHRLLSHRSYKASRGFQFFICSLGTSAAQLGPLWWAAHHRDHHRFADKEGDAHSPVVDGFLRSHIGWIFDPQNEATRYDRIKDLVKFPELRFLNRFYYLPPMLLVVALFFLGELLPSSFNTSGGQLISWGFFLSTVLLYHGTFMVNSVSHIWGRRRFKTEDDSRNNWLVAVLAFGEGWHNNHHRYPSVEKHGYAWYELDPTHVLLKFFSLFGWVRDLKMPPKGVGGL